MRFKSRKVGGYQVFAVSGTNTVSFGIDFAHADTKGLLGFAVERIDPAENQRYYAYGFKVFPSVVPHPDGKATVTTHDHPIQSFVWDDFTAKDGRVYKYLFHPLKGTPKNIDRSAKPLLEPGHALFHHDFRSAGPRGDQHRVVGLKPRGVDLGRAVDQMRLDLRLSR